MRKHFLAEFVGTFALVFVGGAAIMMTEYTGDAGLLQVALAHGLILALMVSAAMNVSGGHFNPAVTTALLVARRITSTVAGVHILAQLIGALAAAWALKMTMPTAIFVATQGGGQSIALDVTMTQAIVLEGIATFFLMFVIYGTAVHVNAPRIGGLAIGLTIAADILAIGPLTGASMNPARSLGPALASGVLAGQVVYWIGPIVGAIAAAMFWEYGILRGEPAVAKPEKSM
ncbi:MAG TPA: aquaporin [Gemmatimonadaceae bacterium]|nr:aquaporin [Gemmatimonadaceae bacterium]